MAQKIYPEHFKHDKQNKKFYVSGKDVHFDTSYILVNPKSGGQMEFSFSHSTGSEWDPNTVWVFKGDLGYELHVGNEDVTDRQKEAYLQAKMHN